VQAAAAVAVLSIHVYQRERAGIELDSDPERAGLVTAALAMAGSPSLEVVSEGVETGAELMAQGFLYARPGTAAEFERRMAQGAAPPRARAGA
jgi:EAL domain-containing protein (putative c-di-GMP-specific phosphodiesterase class I)